MEIALSDTGQYFATVVTILSSILVSFISISLQNDSVSNVRSRKKLVVGQYKISARVTVWTERTCWSASLRPGLCELLSCVLITTQCGVCPVTGGHHGALEGNEGEDDCREL